jgi:hypothetical protein
MRFDAEVAGRFAREALRGDGEVCAAFARSFYLRFPEERYACIGDATLGCGPLNALVREFRPAAIGAAVSVSTQRSRLWQPAPVPRPAAPDLKALYRAANGRFPHEGLGCLISGAHNALSVHVQPALEALERWLVGNALADEAELLIGCGPGLTPSGDDYLAGMLVALRAGGRGVQAQALWRWLGPRLPERTSAISAAHLAAAAAGEAHEALHACLEPLFAGGAAWEEPLQTLSQVGHGSGWDALAGAVAVARMA